MSKKKPHIINRDHPLRVVVQGGLGNQLFTFSAGYAISANSGRLDQMRLVDYWYRSRKVKRLSGFGSRSFELHRFPQIKKEFPLLNTVKQMQLVIRTRFDYHLGKAGSGIVKDKHEPLSRNIQDGATVVNGYFRDHKLFDPYRDELLRLFQLDRNESSVIEETEKELRRSTRDLVAIHVRRGDLVGSVSEGSILPIEYFEQILSVVRSSKSRFVVFSDSPEWCRSIPIFKEAWIMELDDSVHSMLLMSRCDSIVMSRSTLSYWSAWLSKPEVTQVYVPSPFLQAPGFDWERNMLPHWKRFAVSNIDCG